MNEMVLGDCGVGLAGLRAPGSRFLGRPFATDALLFAPCEAHAVRHRHRDDAPDAFWCMQSRGPRSLGAKVVTNEHRPLFAQRVEDTGQIRDDVLVPVLRRA